MIVFRKSNESKMIDLLHLDLTLQIQMTALISFQLQLQMQLKIVHQQTQ